VRIRATLPRDKLVLAQTPQVFRYDLLRAPSKRRARTASSAPTRPAWWSAWMWK
jgi:2-C-methyl-D-erythritol 4-phosphate cytidylyltransferase